MAHSCCKQRHLLNETEVPTWGLLQTIRPIFASQDCKWRLKGREEKGEKLRVHPLSRLNALGYFKDEVRRLQIVTIEDELTCKVWDDCVSTLSDALEFLDSLVKDDVLLESMSNFSTESKTSYLPSWGSIWSFLQGSKTPEPSAIDEPVTDTTDIQFSKLAALARLEGERTHIAAHYIETEQTFEVFQKYRKLEDFTSCVEQASKAQAFLTADFDTVHIPRFARTDWENDAPSEAFKQLHQTLLTHIEQCEDDHHEVLFKMAGARFDKMIFDAIVIPCRNNGKHQKVQFSVENAPGLDERQPRTFVHNLCKAVKALTSSGSLIVPNFIFDATSNARLRCISAESDLHPDILIDTTLAFLQQHEYLLKPQEGGVFKTEDKTVLELVLAQSLLHLLESPWMELPWCSTSIKFPRDHGTDELIDVHRPYVKYLLKSRSSNKPELAQYAEIMTSFARLLLEIESGRAVELSDTDTRKLSRQLFKETNLRDRNYEVRCRVKIAVENCLKFEAILANGMRKEGSEIDQQSGYYIRKAIYESVIRYLEQNLEAFENHESLSQQRKLRMRHIAVESALVKDTDMEPPDFMHSIPVPNAQHTTGEVQQGAAQLDENTSSHSSQNSEYAQVAHQFWDKHKEFYQRYIGPKGQSRQSGSRRIRIAILDTGFDEYSADVRPRIEKIEKGRWQRLIDEFKNNPKNRPKKSTCHPIKASKNFVPSGLAGSVTDTDSHGTTTLGLLLRVAPDADIYVAKVSEGREIADTGAVAKAIEWAAANQADIMSMSFGMEGFHSDIHKAIVRSANIVMFASASNEGTGRDRAYPASDDRVIAIHALSGNGDEGSMNPATYEGQDAFGTLGYGVETILHGKKTFVNGTSYSTPIAAGLVANYLEWIDYMATQDIHDVTDEERDYLKSPMGIKNALKGFMRRRKGNIDFILPWVLFDPDKNGSDSTIIGTLRQMLRDYPRKKKL